jgi:hypothetical protein
LAIQRHWTWCRLQKGAGEVLEANGFATNAALRKPIINEQERRKTVKRTVRERFLRRIAPLCGETTTISTF